MHETLKSDLLAVRQRIDDDAPQNVGDGHSFADQDLRGIHNALCPLTLAKPFGGIDSVHFVAPMWSLVGHIAPPVNPCCWVRLARAEAPPRLLRSRMS